MSASAEKLRPRNVYLTFDCEWCDNIIGTLPLRDATEIKLLRLGLTRFLDICEQKKAPGTIFVTAEVAPIVKDLLHRALLLGLSIGNHSKNHTSVLELSFNEFVMDLDESTSILEDLLCTPILSYRAPSFSMPITVEYYQALAARGYQFDYSAPLGHHMSGVHCTDADLLDIYSCSTGVLTLPMVGIGPKRNIFPGGGYFRIISSSKLINLLQNDIALWPACLYFHPRDLLNFYIPRNTTNVKKFLKSVAGTPTPSQKLAKLIDSLDLLTTSQYHRKCEQVILKLGQRNVETHGF